MLPKFGADCDLCALPGIHYGLVCSKGHEWDEPPVPGKFECPECGEEVSVTDEEHDRWLREVLGIR